MIAARRTAGTAPAMRVLDIEEYIRLSAKPLEENGFFESETARRLDTYGQIAHAFSTYEIRRGSLTAAPIARGINSIQMVQKEGRWWIASLAWDNEGSGENPVPKQYQRR